jgi:hypothetical protein
MFITQLVHDFGFFIESSTGFSGGAEPSSDFCSLFDILEVLLVLFLLIKNCKGICIINKNEALELTLSLICCKASIVFSNAASFTYELNSSFCSGVSFKSSIVFIDLFSLSFKVSSLGY